MKTSSVDEMMSAGKCVASAALAAALLVSAPEGADARQQASAPATSAQAAPAGNADNGRQTYQKKGCYACHGREGQGSPTTGPRLGPNPTPFAAFTRYVRVPRGQMPPYTEKVISDTELADMYAFLQARPRPASIDSLLPR